MDLEIRVATTSDVEPVRELVSSAYSVYVNRMGRRPAPMDADYKTAISSGHVWVAAIGGPLLGLIVLEPQADHLFIENVAVSPGWQGQGFGAQLLAFAEEQALATGLPELRLYTNEVMTENLVYYERRGFIETHRGRSEGFNRVYFAKTLVGLSQK